MVKPILPYGRQSIDDDDVAAVVETLRGDWLTQGPTVAKFEASLAEATGAKYAVAVANGTAALHLACLAAGVKSGDVGITSSITFVASANAIRYCGGRSELVDVDPSTALMSLASLEARISELAGRGKKPSVIIPVDFSGAVADLAAVRAIADRVGALVIEDAAHSLGASYEVGGETYRAGCGVHAQMAILSFHPVKHVTTGEGGAITTNDESLHRELLELRTHGITRDPQKMKQSDGPWYYEQHSLGYNYRLTDIQSALGVSQMRKLGKFVARRRELAAAYDKAFADMSELVAPLAVRPGTKSSYHLYVLRTVPRTGETRSQVAERRRELFVRLREDGIAPQVHYIPVHRQPDFIANGLGRDDLQGAEDYYAGCISLPMFPAMADADVGRVVESVRKALEGTA